jgi:hypothetical protein
VWVAIGPQARSVIRPLGVLGPWPMLGIGLLAVLWMVSMVVAPFLPKPATGGTNWRLAKTDGPNPADAQKIAASVDLPST